MAVLIAAGEAGDPLVPYAATVDPHCVHEASGMPPGIPTVVQSVARAELIIPLHA
jgi:hypothetical protein